MHERLVESVAGPLASHAGDFAGWLEGLDYSQSVISQRLVGLRWLSGWMQPRRLAAGDVDEAMVARMLASLHRQGKALSVAPSSFSTLLEWMRSSGVIPPPAPRALTPMGTLLDEYRSWLRVERGLAPVTVDNYLSAATWFARAGMGDDVERVVGIGPAEIARFVQQVAEVRQPRSVNETVVGLRSFLRFLHATNRIGRPLAQATPWLAQGRRSSLPKVAPAEDIPLLLASCDPSTLVGCRDLAVLTVLVRLGLRAGEVAAIELDDFDWRRGELNVRSKGGWRDLLPVPVDVGEAVAAYLQRRRSTGDRHVFLHVFAPRTPIRMTDVRAIVRRACERAGVAQIHPHELRRAAGTAMLAAGAPLHEIGQVLRHRDLETTAIYAKVDFATLSTVARDWPGQ